ncbi:MAG TPA: hypothetical protein VJ967_07460 [Clostridia bacterium]|nr:hypothetical protein [Clostridia bacterium]
MSYTLLFRYFTLTFLGMGAAAAVVLVLSALQKISYRRAALLMTAIGTAGLALSASLLFL